MASIVIYPVPRTVNTTRATYWMEPVLDANLDGQEQIVTQVRLCATSTMFGEKSLLEYKR